MMRLLAVFALLALGASARGVTGVVVDDQDRPVPKAKISVWTFWVFDRTFHADGNGEFVYLKSSDWEGKVSQQTYTIVDATGKAMAKATVVMPWYGDVPLHMWTDRKGQFDFPLPDDTKGMMRILDGSGQPVARAKAICSDKSSANALLEMNAQGEHLFPALQNRTTTKRELRFHVTADGYAYSGAYFTEGQTLPLVFKLIPESPLMARIVDEDGAPVPGASVCLNDVNGRGKASDDFDSVGYDIMPVPIITIKDGTFVIPHLPGPGPAKSLNVQLTVFASGRCKIVRVFDLAELRKSGEIVLPRMCSLQGIIRPPAGIVLPEEMSLVMRLREQFGPTEPSEHFATADKNGRFAFEQLPPGTATIRLQIPRKKDPGWMLPAIRDLQLAGGGSPELDLTGTTGALISGCVRDQAGNPIEMAVVRLRHSGNPDGESMMADEALTDKKGNYTARVGSGKVEVYLDFCFLGEQSIRYKPGNQPTISVELSEGETRPGLDFTASPKNAVVEEPLKRKR